MRRVHYDRNAIGSSYGAARDRGHRYPV